MAWMTDRAAGNRAGGEAVSGGIGLVHYLVVAALLFTTGVLGIFLNRKNIIVIFSR